MSSSSHIANIRQDYSLADLNEEVAGNNPIAFFHKWFDEGILAKISEVNAMTLATVDQHGKPHARIVLLKGVEQGAFVFFTNYLSAKGHQIGAQAHVSLLFFWKELERQVRIEGIAEMLDEAESTAYFNSRPFMSRVGAWASPQSQKIDDRSVLEQRFTQFQEKYTEENIPKPPHWGGYRVIPQHIEFWQGRPSRLHDRILFSYAGNDHWNKCRLAP